MALIEEVGHVPDEEWDMVEESGHQRVTVLWPVTNPSFSVQAMVSLRVQGGVLEGPGYGVLEGPCRVWCP